MLFCGTIGDHVADELIVVRSTPWSIGADPRIERAAEQDHLGAVGLLVFDDCGVITRDLEAIGPIAGEHIPLLRPIGCTPGLCLPRRALPDGFGHQLRGVELHGLKTLGRQLGKDRMIRHERL